MSVCVCVSHSTSQPTHLGHINVTRHMPSQAANKDSRKIPKGAKQKLLVKRNHKVTDKRGRRYVGGDPNDRSLLGESTRRKKKRKVKVLVDTHACQCSLEQCLTNQGCCVVYMARQESSNPFVRFFQQQIKKFKRKMYLRRANKAPVVLGDRARAVAEALECKCCLLVYSLYSRGNQTKPSQSHS